MPTEKLKPHQTHFVSFNFATKTHISHNERIKSLLPTSETENEFFPVDRSTCVTLTALKYKTLSSHSAFIYSVFLLFYPPMIIHGIVRG